MAKETSTFDPEVVIPKIKNLKQKIVELILKRKKIALVVGVIVLILLFVGIRSSFKSSKPRGSAKSTTVKLGKSFTFNAVNNQGKPTGTKIKFKIADAEKTDQVLVKDQTFTAKNNKLFLIFNLELTNDETSSNNILPGDLMRLSIGGDDETRFAPDLHNSLVGIAALSTKIDRVGFVIPAESKNFKLYIGELEGKKEEVKVDFPS